MTLPKEPYYAVIFTSTFKDDIDLELYAETGTEMEELAKRQPGFMGVDSTRNTSTTLGITVSYWKDQKAIAAWKKKQEHLVAQRMGKQAFYKHFKTVVAKVEREYEFGSQ